MNQHRLIVDRRLVEEDQTRDPSQGDGSYQLFYQMTRITRDRGALAHDDRLEALAMAVHYWTEMLSQDVKKSEETFKAEWLGQELERFEAHALGRKATNTPCWIPPWNP